MFSRIFIAIATFAAFVLLAPGAQAQIRIGDFCHVKGLEENTLHGIGLVVGLKGTGDNEITPTTRAIARMMELMHHPLPLDNLGKPMYADLKSAKNMALVFITVTVPANGAREGDRLDCRVSSAFNAKSLAGGVLMMSPLYGPRADQRVVLGLSSGPVHLDEGQTTVGAIHNGCRLEVDLMYQFVNDNSITLVLDKNHAGFQIASEIADVLRTAPEFRKSDGSYPHDIATAIDPVNVRVKISDGYFDDPVAFVTQVLDQRIFHERKDGRVVINERAGTVVIGSGVEIGAVAVTHRGLAIETGQFVEVDPETYSNAGNTRLSALVAALNAIKATPEDIIAIIKGLNRNGQLFGELIIE